MSFDADPTEPTDPRTDPRAEEVEGDTGMPAEFVDTPEHVPGEHGDPEMPSLRDTKVDPDEH